MQELREAIPEGRVADFFSADEDIFLTEDKRTTWAYVYPKEFESFSDPLPDEALQPALDAAEQADRHRLDDHGLHHPGRR